MPTEVEVTWLRRGEIQSHVEEVMGHKIAAYAIRAALSRGEIPLGALIGQTRFYRESDIDAWIESCTLPKVSA